MTILERRQGLGWTQEHLAQTSGISARTIQRLENGAAGGSDSLQALAAALGCDVTDLLNNVPTEGEEKYAKQLLGFRANWITALVLMPFLVLLNVIYTPGAGWIIFALGGWGVGILAHAALVFLVYRPAYLT